MDYFYHVHGQLLNLVDTLSPSSGTYTLNVEKNALKPSVSEIKGHILGLKTTLTQCLEEY